MIIFFSDEGIVKKIEDICKVTGETQSQVIEGAVKKFLSTDSALKVIEANSKLNRSQIGSFSQLRSTSKVFKLMNLLDSMEESEISDRYKKIISMRFGLKDYKPHTLEQIGQSLGITRERVRQIIVKLLTDPENADNKLLVDQDYKDVSFDDNYVYNDLLKSAEEEVESEIYKIIEFVAQTFSKSTKELITKKRTADIAFVRQFAMYVLRNNLQLSTPRIGKIFHRDHTTVLHALSLIEEKLSNDAKLQGIYNKIIDDIPSYQMSEDGIARYDLVLVESSSGNEITKI